MTTVALTGSGNWVVPTGVTSVRVQCWGGCGSGGGTNNTIGWNGGGGGGGEYAEEPTYAVTPGQQIAYAVGAGGAAKTAATGAAGANTTFGTVTAHGGQGGKTQQSANAAGGAGGTGSTNSIHFNGGAGGAGTFNTNSGGGGGGAGTGSAGNNASGITGGAAVTGGAAGPNGTSTGNGTAGTAPNGTTTGGSGGAGAYSNTAANRTSGAGGAGQILLTYTASSAAAPYLMANPAPAASTTATTVPITTGSGTGDAIIVAASTPLAASNAPASVSDTQGNTSGYLLAQPVLSNLATWIADGPVPLGTSDSVQVTWTTTGSNVKDVMVVGVPGAAQVSALDTNATASASGTGTTVSVTSGTIANPNSIAILVISNSSTGGTPSALGSFTSLGTVELSTFQYLTVAYQQLSGTSPVTGSATITSTSWAADLLIISPSSIAAAGGAVVGATIEAGSYPAGTLSGSISTWQNSVINPGRTLDSIRIFFGPGNIPSSVSSAGLSQHVGVRRVLMSMKPALAGSGGEAADKAAIDAFLASCKNAGLDAKVALYHEPDSAAKLTASQYKTTIQYYSSTVRKYYPLVYCKAAYKTHTNPSSPGDFYPGDAWVDECAYDFYETDYRLYGVTATSMSNIADAANPPKPFSFWELGVQVSSISGTTSPANATQSQGTAYMNYILNFLTTRVQAGKLVGDVSYYDYVNSAQNWNFVIGTSGVVGHYLAPLYDQIYDAMSATGTGPSVVSLAAELDAGIAFNATLTTTTTTPSGSGGQPSVAGFPQLIVEAALIPQAPVAVLGSFILDDPVYGKLDAGRLGDSNAWTDITGYVRTLSVSRPFTREQGPLLSYQAGTLSAVLDNSDGRFDPDNGLSPYVVGGVSAIRAMIPVRVRALYGAAEYALFYGFADGWQPSPVDYEGGYAELTLSATDGFKVLGGLNLPAINPAGGGETTGARVNRILNVAGWYTDRRKVAAGDSTVQDATFGDSPLNLLQVVADSEIGELYQDGSGNVVFRNRHAILTDTRSSTPQAVFGDSPGNVQAAGTEIPYATVVRASDDTTLANDIQAAIAGSANVQEVTDAASVAKYLFARTYSRTDLILQTDADALAWAQWVLYVSKTGETRFDSLAVDPLAQPADLLPQVLGRDIGDRIQVVHRPANVASPVIRDCFIRGIQHDADLTAQTWLTTWTLQDASRYAGFLILDNATFGQLDHYALGF